MRKYLFIFITALVVMGAALVVVAGYNGKFFKREKEQPLSASQAILDLQKHNTSTGKLYAEGKIELFENGNAVASESMAFKYCVSGGRFYQMTGPVEMINGKDYAVYVHHDKQFVQVAHPDDLPVKQLFSHATIIDSMMRINQMDASVQSAEGGLMRLTIAQPGGEQVSAYHILYDPADFIIKKIEMEMGGVEDAGTGIRSKQLIVISYAKLSQSIDEEEAMFSEKRFIKKLRRSFALTDEFSGYQLINLIPDK
jgi:hypothetical protein